MSTVPKTEAAFGPSFIHPTAFVHPLAFVDGAKVGARTRIWQFASVIRGAVLGDDCSIASGVTVDGCQFGDRCVVSQGVTLAPGQFFESEVFLGPNSTFCNDRWPRADKVGFDIDALLDGKWTIVIEYGASIGAGAVVLPGVRVGIRAMIAAGATVTRNVPDWHLWTRDGRLVAIDRGHTQRMRFVG